MSIQKILLVLKFEFLTTIRRRSVLFVMFGLPILSIIVLTVLNQLAASGGSADSGPSSLLENIVQGPGDSLVLDGIVDQSHILTEIPPNLKEYLALLPDQNTAENAFEAKEIKGYFLIPSDYLATGEIKYYAEENPINHPQEQMLGTLLTNDLLNNPQLAQRVVDPSHVETVDLSRPEDEQENSAEQFGQSLALGIGLAILFYMTVIGSAGYLLQSLGKEKQNRVLEILLSSTRPVELLIGKMIGLGAIGVVQLLIWTVIVTLVLGRGNSFLGNIQLPNLEPATWFFAISFFLVGYLVYGSLFAGLGAVSPGQKESSQYTFFLMLPTFVPVWLNTILITAPNKTPAVLMSLFPLTSPIAMPMRLAATAVPIWQIGLSLALGILTAVGMLYIATRFFRSQTLLSGQGVNLRRIVQAARGSD
ncbi:MAG: ABC transporter permease [Candidatus Promineifilaceae bacterium]